MSSSIPTSVLRCRFCALEIAPTKNGKPHWANLAGHVADKHKKENDQISEHMRARTAPGDLSKRAVSRSRASLGYEFRTKLGYGTGATGAEQRDDGDDQ